MRQGLIDLAVEAFLREPGGWRDEYARLRAIALGCGLTESLKWGVPCYALEGRNIVLMHGFKDYCALLFFKGALMKDPSGILIRQTKNVQAGRQVRFRNVSEIEALAAVLKAYIEDAIAVEKSGLKVEFRKTAEFPMPDEFRARLDEHPALRSAFEELTPGRQRAYLLHVSAAKQLKTRLSRIETCVPRILDGKGLDD